MRFPYMSVRISMRAGMGYGAERVFHSAFRGVFGRVLRETFCVQRRLLCSGCPMRTCLYRRIFEDEGVGHEVFRPYIVRHLETLADVLTMELIILGSITEFSSSIIYALIRLEDHPMKIHGEDHPIRIQAIRDADDSVVYSADSGLSSEPKIQYLEFTPEPCSALALNFITPLRMKHEGRLMNSFNWGAFLRALHSRVSYLDEQYNSGALGLPELWTDDAITTSKMEWREMYRKSYRQQQKMSLGGLTGLVTVNSPDPRTLGLLKIGTTLQAGKQTTFGLGKYIITTK